MKYVSYSPSYSLLFCLPHTLSSSSSVLPAPSLPLTLFFASSNVRNFAHRTNLLEGTPETPCLGWKRPTQSIIQIFLFCFILYFLFFLLSSFFFLLSSFFFLLSSFFFLLSSFFFLLSLSSLMNEVMAQARQDLPSPEGKYFPCVHCSRLLSVSSQRRANSLMDQYLGMNPQIIQRDAKCKRRRGKKEREERRGVKF